MPTYTKEVVMMGLSFDYATKTIVARYCDMFLEDGVGHCEVSQVKGFEDGDLAGVLALCDGDVNAPLYLAAVFLWA